MGRLFLTDWNLEELAPAAHFNAHELATLCGISTRQLQRHFRFRFRCSPQSWLNYRRLLVAEELLLSGDSVKKVALDLGFKQPSHFCKQFKTRTHMTPSEFVDSQLQNVAGG